MQQFPEPRRVDIGGTRLAVYEPQDFAKDALPVLLVHGWPELAYSWRNQLPALARAGCRPIAFDLKGFGYSDCPKDIALYDADHLTADMAALLDALEIERAVFLGHDWGGALVWSMGQLRPERVAGIVSVCTPLRARAPAPPIDILRKRFGDEHYFVQFQEPGVIEALFATDPDLFFHMMFQKPAPRERWPALVPAVYDLPGRFKRGKRPDAEQMIVGEDVIGYYVKAYKRSGFHGGANLYRNVNRNWELMDGRAERVMAPSLWVGAGLDLFLPPESAEDMEALVPDLEKHIIPDCGHWLMWENPDALNALITDWLQRRFSI